jgi:hypothetical protein
MTLDVVSSNKIIPFLPVSLGSSSTDGEDRDYLQFLVYPIIRGYCPSGHYLALDIASYLTATLSLIGNETYKDRVTIAEEMIEHDIYVQMPPKKRFSVKAKIIGIRKAEPRIVTPENPYFET